ncbi:hypothetical protein J6590_050033 [Homalodisca vitripennis]|nr:hypothetical protein J6590_050033 [Homalodisca vitripennis]
MLSDSSEEIKGNWILLAMIALGMWTFTSSIPLILKNVEDAGPLLVIPYINSFVLSYLTVLHIVILKHALAKRLRTLRTLGKSPESVAQLISTTRQLLDYNSTINVESAVFVTTIQISSIVLLINYCYVVWIIHVAGWKLSGAFENHLLLSVLAYSGLFSIRVLMDVYSAILTDERGILHQVSVGLDTVSKGGSAVDDTANTLTKLLASRLVEIKSIFSF